MPRLAGNWGTPTIEGPRTLIVDGVSYGIPADAIVKIVSTPLCDIAHIHCGRVVVVLSRLGQLMEDDRDARARAGSTSWGLVAS